MGSYCIIIGCKPQPTPHLQTLKAAIEKYGEGLYTVMRTANQTSIFAINMHADRIRISTEQLKSMVASVYESEKWKEEQRLTVAVFKQVPQVYLQCEALPVRPKHKPVRVGAVYADRQDASNKRTEWVHERQSLTSDDYEENIIVDQRSKQYREGLSSNFSVIKKRTVFTAPKDTVLQGTVMKMVEQVAQEQGMNVNYDGISIHDSFEAAFITSTSRLVMPVDEIILPDKSIITLSSSTNQIVAALKARVQERVVQESQSFMN